MPTVLPLTGSLLKAYNNLPAIPPNDPLGDIINQLNAGSGGVTGAPNALVYINSLGTGTVTDAALVVAPPDVFLRPQIWDTRLGGAGAVWRQGAWQADGDPASVVGDGIVLYGLSTLGNLNPVEGAYNRQKSNRMGLAQILPGVNGGNLYYLARIDPNGLAFQDDSATPIITSFIDRLLGRMYLGAGVSQHGSNAGFQVNSIIANRGAARFNQYGANAGVPGVTGFKSRGATVGSLAKVVAGDTLWRATAIGVADDNATLGIAATLGINVPVGGVPAGQSWVATDYVLELQPLAGPVNGRKQAFKVDSEGIVYVKESANTMAGIATIGAGGNIVVANTRVTATTRFQLTAQDGGSVPTGSPFVVSRVVGTSFTIQSTAGAADSGVNVYYQLFEATTP